MQFFIFSSINPDCLGLMVIPQLMLAQLLQVPC